ncbi:MAG: YHYH protein, partial [Minisyncoccia bacterium]
MEFFKQYYISQEYQGGPVDITDNLDQYLKVDNLTPEVIVGFTTLSENISSTSSTIQVTSTKGFPQKYGLLKIDDEIITYTGLTTNTFTGCIRGFSGITNYHKDLNFEELVFSTSDSSSHATSSKVENLSSLFLQEFYKKIKYTLTPDLENKNFVSSLNVGNFIKEARTLYQTKGTEESFRILFNVLFGETPKIINLEDYLIKPSSANYIRRLIVVADAVSGNPVNLEGQTITRTTDSNTTASVSEVEVIKRKNKTYYKLLLFIGYDDPPTPVTGEFKITGSTKNIESVSIGSSAITVDSTIGFPQAGTIYCGDNVIKYTDKSINQFFGCSGITSSIDIASVIFSEDTYFGYENGDKSKKVVLRLTGVLTGYTSIESNSIISVGERIGVKSIGKLIQNPDTNKSYKEIFSNSWIYNTSSRYEIIDNFTPNVSSSQITLKSVVDPSSLKVGDFIEILFRNTETVVQNNLKVNNISINGSGLYQITTNSSFILSSGSRYDIRRKIKNASSSVVPFEVEPITSDIQNIYDDSKNTYMYVASNSLPSYEITKSLCSYEASGVSDLNVETGLYSKITFSNKVSFFTGNEIYYKPSETSISGLVEGIYYVEVLSGNLEIRLYPSKSVVGTSNYLSFGSLTEGTHSFILNSQKEEVLSPQKILRKFPLSVNNGDGKSDETPPGATGILVNGVEIFNYKTINKIYYGPLEKVNVLNGGKNYDVINPPLLTLSTGDGLVQSCINGSVEKIYVTPQNFDTDVIVSIALTGGNGSGAVFQPIIEKKRREINFDARLSTFGGGVNVSTETITFLTEHNLIDGQEITYRSLNNTEVGIGTYLGSNTTSTGTLKDETTYYAEYVNNFTIRLYPSIADYRSGINTIGFTTSNASGIQRFVTEVRNTLSEIKVLDGGSNYRNRKLRVSPSGISTTNNFISFINHGFNDGEKVKYSNTGNSLVGLSTDNQYYVLKIDDNSFRLANAGIGGTIRTNYERKAYVGLGSTVGSGYHIFSDPEISIKVEYSSVGLSTNQYNGLIDCTPVVRGEISSVYVYEGGNGYGSSILNYHKKPIISVKNGKDAQCKPIIIDGKIEDVAIQFGGSEYYSNPDINAVDLSGSGKGAVLKPVIVNNKLTDVVIVNTGIGYSSKDTRIEVIPSGKNAIFDSQVRSLTVNDNFLYGTISNTSSLIIPANEILKSSYNNLQYGVCGYFQKAKDEFDDNNANKHSPIIGWAYDGNPIYGSFGYSNPGINSSVRRLNSGYSLNISNVNDRPVGFSSGFFVEDYQFTNSGDLDEYNGRFCVTKDFPQGVYAYFATTEENNNGETVGKFPYFIGSRYRSKFIEDNKSLDQTYDFNNSSLIRNTFPYKIGDRTASNDFIIESNEVINQFSVVESVTSGSVESFDIISSGDDYRVGETLVFDETETGGGGLIAQISELSGKDIVSLENQTLEYNDAIFEWKNGNQIKVKIFPYHNLNDLDYVSISGFSSSLSTLNGINRIGINSFTTSLLKDIPSLSSGIVTDVYVSSIPENISVGSSIKIGSGTLSILNIFNNQSIAIQTATTPVYFTPDSFTIDKSIEYFDSTVNDLVYFNPSYSIGIGTTAGTDVEVAYNVGVQTSNTILIPTQSIYLPNHPFRTNQVVTLRKPPAGGSTFTVSNTSGGPTFSIPSSGDSQTVYIIRKSADHVGIVTQIGLTTSTNGLFFTSFVGGSYDYQYSLESNFTQIKGDVKKITTTVSISTEHNLSDGDTVSLFVSPQLSVGIGTSSFVKILREENTNYILANPINFNSTGVNTTTNTITISSHGLKTGDRVKYSADTVISGLSTGFYYVYKVDSNKIKLTETYIDAAKTDPPLTISFNSTGGSSQIISLVNPHISAVKNNDLVFDVSDSSLFGYNFKLFYDNEFYDEFVSIGSTNIFVISGVGTIGLSTNATVTLRYNDSVPSTLFYALEKSGDIVSVDNELRESSKITYNNSVYQNSYKVFGVGTTTFNICLTDFPEKNSYSVEECDTLRYTTSSTSALGGVEKIRILSPGFNFKKLPIFDVVDSTSGTGAYVKPNSKSIGKINEIRIVNEGFEYSSDKTLRPESSVSRFMYVENSNTINSVQVLYGGRNYISAPNIVIIDSSTGEKIDSGLFKVNLTAASNSIESITIDVPPKGLPESIVTLKTINNTNGVGIKTVQYSSSGIVTCYLITPSSGFSTEPFVVGDRIFVEGIQKETNDGTGFNSEDYGYEFFEIDSYTPST